MTFIIRPATEQDVPTVLGLINELAVYEKLGHEVRATEHDIRAALFGAKPAAEAVIGWDGGAAAGFALFFQNFSTFVGKPGLYLEDLFVLPQYRHRGLGRQLLSHLAGIAVERGYGRMEWAVLDWNEPALRVYRGIGAKTLDEWKICRLTGESLARAAQGSD